MILILTPNVTTGNEEYQRLMRFLAKLDNIETRVNQEQGVERTLTEIYLIGNTAALNIEDMKSLPCVEHVVRVS